MQVGTITVDGREIGVVSFGESDDFASPFSDGDGDTSSAGARQSSEHPHAAHRDGPAPHGGRHREGGQHRERKPEDHFRSERVERATGDSDVGAGLSGSEYIRARRERFAREMRENPTLREQVAGMLVTEGAQDPLPVAESLMNRADYTGGTLHGHLHSGFYGPINRGQLPGAIAHLRASPALRERMDTAIDRALAGSNEIRGATDQGLPTDPNGRWQGGRIVRGGNVFNDWGGGPGGHSGSRAYRENFQRAVTQETTAKAEEDKKTAATTGNNFNPETMAP